MLTREQNEMISQTGPGTPMGDLFRRFWMPALMSSELPTPDCPPVRVRLMGEDLVAFRDSEGKVGLLAENCPHRRASLFFGRNEESGLRCAYHGWKYDVTGSCVDMPNEPAESNFKNKVHITAYPTREAGGLIWAYMGPKDKIADPPQIEWTMLPESHWIVSGKVFVECNYLQAMEGEIDNSHVGFLHMALAGQDLGGQAGNLGSGQSQASTAHYVARDKTPRGIVKDAEFGVMMGWRRNADEEHYHWHINQWLAPHSTLLGFAPGLTQLTVLRTPASDETSWGFIVHWNPTRPLTAQERELYKPGKVFMPALVPGSYRPKANKENDFLIDRSLQKSYSFTGIPDAGFYNQDLAMTISMGAIVDRTKEHLGSSDSVVIAIRRKLLRMAQDLQQGKEPYAARHGDAYRVRSVDIVLPKGVPFDEGAREGMKVPDALGSRSEKAAARS